MITDEVFQENISTIVENPYLIYICTKNISEKKIKKYLFKLKITMICLVFVCMCVCILFRKRDEIKFDKNNAVFLEKSQKSQTDKIMTFDKAMARNSNLLKVSSKIVYVYYKGNAYIFFFLIIF